MEYLLTKESAEFKELIGRIRTAHKSVMTVRERHRPTIADERYLTGEEVMEYLHISPRTLQNLRDNRLIPFTTIGGNRGLPSSPTGARSRRESGGAEKAKRGKILYPERELQQVLLDNYTPVEPTF
jgi:hypothetical protein